MGFFDEEDKKAMIHLDNLPRSIGHSGHGPKIAGSSGHARNLFRPPSPKKTASKVGSSLRSGSAWLKGSTGSSGHGGSVFYQLSRLWSSEHRSKSPMNERPVPQVSLSPSTAA